MSVFVHAQGIKLSKQDGGVKKWQNSVHVVVERPLSPTHRIEKRQKNWGLINSGNRSSWIEIWMDWVC